MDELVALYQRLIPGHSGIDPTLLASWLTYAVARHDGGTFGAVHDEAMCWYVAAFLHPLVQQGLIGVLSTGACGPAVLGKKEQPAKVEDNPFWMLYIDARDSRSESGPGIVTFGRLVVY